MDQSAQFHHLLNATRAVMHELSGLTHGVALLEDISMAIEMTRPLLGKLQRRQLPAEEGLLVWIQACHDIAKALLDELVRLQKNYSASMLPSSSSSSSSANGGDSTTTAVASSVNSSSSLAGSVPTTAAAAGNSALAAVSSGSFVSANANGNTIGNNMNAVAGGAGTSPGLSLLELSMRDPRLRANVDRKSAHLTNHLESLKPLLSAPKAEEIARGTSITPPIQVTNSNSVSSKLIDVKNMIDDEEGLAFWVDHFGVDCYSVDWITFRNALAAANFKLTMSTLTMLEQSLDHVKSETVNASTWGSFLQNFGPGISRALVNMGDTLGEKFFAGFIGFDEAQEVLRCCPIGAFLVRFSANNPCGFAIAFKDAGPQTVTQFVVQARTHAGGFELDGEVYASLKDLLQAKSDVLRFPAPTIQSISKQRYFKGFISFEETCELLDSKPPGTFLFRFSRSEPGSVVVAYVAEGGKIRQTKIPSEPDNGGYVLGHTIYPTLDEIIRNNSSKLKYPLGSQDVAISNKNQKQEEGGVPIPQKSPNRTSTSFTLATSLAGSNQLEQDGILYGSIPTLAPIKEVPLVQHSLSQGISSPYGQIPSGLSTTKTS